MPEPTTQTRPASYYVITPGSLAEQIGHIRWMSMRTVAVALPAQYEGWQFVAFDAGTPVLTVLHVLAVMERAGETTAANPS